ncbi:hypothetical protein QBC34DRAFT_318669 [Podospora aff. communis PSN243]|uniref:Major facilitator superfamily transporter n=1 Tax=Podospora aff. communis PSN243 TaxID=3040156 RepID=A0AAV9GYI6_9PEZI|nr:hypothetical protein QBC34DRAFT_318669 [Podospora aff. communis PSN243]
MERAPVSNTRKKSASFSSSSSIGDEKYGLLPLANHRKPKIRVRTLLGHCLYRRVIIWTVAALFLLGLTASTTGIHLRHGRVLDFVDFRQGGRDSRGNLHSEEEGITFVITVPGRDEPEAQVQNDQDDPYDQGNLPAWLSFKYLDGYFIGIKALVSPKSFTAEYPRTEVIKHAISTPTMPKMPTPTAYVPYPDYDSRQYLDRFHEVEVCYLDNEKTMAAPNLYAYSGIVQGQPEPVIGSHTLLGLRDDVCFDRFGRYGPYGFGYSYDEGGLDVGMDTEQEASHTVWAKTGKFNYNTMDWGDAQDRCYNSNRRRFIGAAGDWSTHAPNGRAKISRTAVVVRTYIGVEWTPHVILNFRALISELALRSGGEYGVHFLLHVRDDDAPIWADAAVAQQVLDDYVPAEFHSICTLWSEAQMRLLYPGSFGESFSDPSNADIHGVYRSAHMPLQDFAMKHPEYAHFWNWEMDMRFLGNYYELFDRLGAWAREQTRMEMWERAQKYYIPRYHGSWDNFTRLVHDEIIANGRGSVLGPVDFPGRSPTRAEQSGQSFLPHSCYLARNGDEMWNRCGVGEEADLITLNPLFDTDESGWVFAEDVTGYDRALPIPPRRCAIVTASRLSRRLLQIMHEETWRMRHAMFSEMFPASMALHHGLKAVYAPHPVYLDREWDLQAVDDAFNGGRDHSSSGYGSPFGFENEHNHKGATWYYHSEFAGLLWRRWLGYAQMDGRGESGQVRGGREDEERRGSTGRMCLRSMLVHPIKWENPADLE